MSHPSDRQSWPQFRRTTPGRRRLDRSRWSWMTQSGSASCGPRRHHRPSPPSCVAGCRSDSDSVNCSCTWMEAMYCHHCWRSLPWPERCPASGAQFCEMTFQSLIGWWVLVRDTLHLHKGHRTVTVGFCTDSNRWHEDIRSLFDPLHVPSDSVSSLHTLSRSAFPWMYLLYSLILRAQLRSGCLTVFFSLRRAFANQLETCADASCYGTVLTSL